jgi:hypothetical protein
VIVIGGSWAYAAPPYLAGLAARRPGAHGVRIVKDQAERAVRCGGQDDAFALLAGHLFSRRSSNLGMQSGTTTTAPDCS